MSPWELLSCEELQTIKGSHQIANAFTLPSFFVFISVWLSVLAKYTFSDAILTCTVSNDCPKICSFIQWIDVV